MARKSIKKYGARRRRGGDDGPKPENIPGIYDVIGDKRGYLPTTVRKTKGGRTKRRMRGGYYGATGAIAPGAMEWERSSEMGDFAANSTRAGNNAVLGAGRKRRGTKKVGRRTRRKMRGGGKYGGVAAAFGGDGVAGMANYTGVTSRDNVGVPFYGKFNDHGAGPSSGFGSFVKAV